MNLYPNLAVADLDRSRRFFSALGFGFDPRMDDGTCIAMRISDAAYVMMLTHEKFASFAPERRLGGTEVLMALQLDSREAVDQMVRTAQSEGGEVFRDPEDHGFMYGHSFTDPDGHIWEPFCMTPEGTGDA